MEKAETHKVNTVFGPVPSRRLGRSLGIDPVPLKTCNFNCVYCQLGRTPHLVNTRHEYVPSEHILGQVQQTLAAAPPGTIDWVTFVGSGETTLHSGLGWLIRQVKSITTLPIAVITNGSLLSQPDVRDELAAAEAVMPSLDAGTSRLYRTIARPHPDFTFGRHVQGLVDFRRDFAGMLWLEVMLIRDLNDSADALHDIAAAVQRVDPDEIHISLPTRPPVETWVQPADWDAVMRATAVLGCAARVLHPGGHSVAIAAGDDPAQVILDIITRHPMRLEELQRCLDGWDGGCVFDVLEELQAAGRVQRVTRYGVAFWTAAPASFPVELTRH